MDIEGNEVYYRIIHTEGKFKEVCMQWFDEFDYNEENMVPSIRLYSKYKAVKVAELLNWVLEEEGA